MSIPAMRELCEPRVALQKQWELSESATGQVPCKKTAEICWCRIFQERHAMLQLLQLPHEGSTPSSDVRPEPPAFVKREELPPSVSLPGLHTVRMHSAVVAYALHDLVSAMVKHAILPKELHWDVLAATISTPPARPQKLAQTAM